MEVPDPKLVVLCHLMSPLEAIDVLLESPLVQPLLKQRIVAGDLMNEVAQSKMTATGMLLANMERNSWYYIPECPFHSTNHFSRVPLHIVLRDKQRAEQPGPVLQQLADGEPDEVRPQSPAVHLRPHAGPVHGGGDDSETAHFRSGHALPQDHHALHGVHGLRVQSVRGRRQGEVREELVVLDRSEDDLQVGWGRVDESRLFCGFILGIYRPGPA